MSKTALALALCASACAGEIVSPGTHAPPGQGASGGGAATGGTGGGLPPAVTTKNCKPASPGRVVLQRLTRAEYNRTVRDLFAVTEQPASVFPPDSATGGFDNNAGGLTISPQLADMLFDAAEKVATEAVQTARGRIFVCDPVSMGRDPCASTILTRLALRVFRRPATPDEIGDLMAFVALGEKEGDGFAGGIRYALQAMLVSPQFLYRGIPAAPQPLDGAVVALDDYALATRLSYFVWGSTPDDALLAAAGAGKLRDATAFRAELARMLKDKNAAALYDGFFSQWLAIGRLAAAAPDTLAFPFFNEQLRADMMTETRLVFEDMLARNASALELVSGTSTFVNQSLASIYGISSVAGAQFRRVDLNPAERAGMTGKAAILTMTGSPLEPNMIVRRGAWIAENLLCAVGQLPAGIEQDLKAMGGDTPRRTLERNQANPVCAPCHRVLDPLGFGLQNYDGIGRWRTAVGALPMDNVGTLPDGRTFAGPVELSKLLMSENLFKTCITEKVAMYALGRTMNGEEHCGLETIGRAVVAPDAGFSDLLWAVATSDAFQKRERERGP